MASNGSKAKRRASKLEATRAELAPDAERTGNRVFPGPTVTADALQNRIAQARALYAGNAGAIVQAQALRTAKANVQRFSDANGPASASVRSVPGVNVKPNALSSRVDLLKPLRPAPRLLLDKSLPSPFLQKVGFR